MRRWYAANNLPFGPITAEVTDGKGIVEISDLGFGAGQWSLNVTAKKSGRAIVTVTGAVPNREAARKFSFLIEVENKAKLQHRQSYGLTDYG